jgi:phosphoglycerol transferase MdoB-like AlkP superfamily enzyme
MPKAAKQPGDFERVFHVFALGALAAAVLDVFLYLRRGPFGTPFVLNIGAELPRAVFYEWHSLALIALPFFILALRARTGHAKIQRGVFIALTFSSLVIEHADNETRRFMGIHLSINYLQTYGNVARAPTAIGQAVADDPGGAFSAYILLLVPLLFLAAAVFLNGRPFVEIGKKTFRGAVACGVVLFYMLPILFWNTAPADSPVHARIKPPAILVFHEVRELFSGERSFDGIQDSIKIFKSLWNRQDKERRWEFTSHTYPLRKSHRGPCPRSEGDPWNFILIQLETFRAKDMRLFNPDLDKEPTPFLDRLGRDPNSAYWPKFFANGLPTVYAFMALHTGLLPHTKKRVATAFTDTNIEALPQFLKRLGYHTAFFSGPDPDWDNERFWLSKWYDHAVFDPTWGEEDRPLFRDAADYLMSRGRKKEPFWTTVVSIANHVPFRSPEPELNIAKGETIFDRLHNTMHYTDDVVREFYETVKNEPWFGRTVLIVLGDHGYDLGDRGWVIGHTNLRHETIWVPLIVHGPHPALPRGAQETVGSHIDVAPTVMELAGACYDNSFMGHSLIRADESLSSAAAVRDENFAFETASFSSYFPKGDKPMIFDRADMMQLSNLYGSEQKIAREHLQTAESLFEVADYVLERDLVAPRQ